MAQFSNEQAQTARLVYPMPQYNNFRKALRYAGFLLALGLSIALGTNEALAQSAACQSIQGELANLGRGDPRAASQANRARSQVQRISGYMASIGCDRQRILMFGSNPPPECGPLRGQLQQAQAELASAQAASGGNPAYTTQRRRDLQAALQNYGCYGSALPDGQRPRGLIENLFGAPMQEPPPRYDGYGMQNNGLGTPEVRPETDLLDPDTPNVGNETPDRPASGGGKPVCVRTCDGYFFPLDIGANRARSDSDALCQALCPGAQTTVYFMPSGGDIEGAISAEGQNYTALPAALRYRQSVQPSCACKGKSESWASLLKPAEGLLGNEHSEDVTVTPEKSLEMSRPALPQSPKAVADQQTARPATKAAKPDQRTLAKPPLTAGDQSQINDLTVDENSKRPTRVFPPILRGQN